MPDQTYSADLLGHAAVTRFGERGTITGPAMDPARCRFQPDAPGTEYFTPRVASLTFREPCVCAGTGDHTGQGVADCDECNPAKYEEEN